MRLRWVGGQLCPFPKVPTTKGSWLDWGLQRAYEEWRRTFGIDHTSWYSSQCLVSWWANSTLTNELDAPRYVPLCDCHTHLHVVHPIRTVSPCRLSTRGMVLQKIAYRGCPRSEWSKWLVSRSCELACFLQVDLLSGGMSRSHASNQFLFHWYCIQVQLLLTMQLGGRLAIMLVPL